MAADRQALSPEAKLLFLAAAVSPSESALRQSLSGGIDWAELCFLAQHENAASILVRLLDRVGADSNNSGYQQLRQLARISTMQMLQLEQLLHETIGILAREDIDAVLLKGSGLAYTAYLLLPGQANERYRLARPFAACGARVVSAPDPRLDVVGDEDRKGQL